MKQQMRNHKVQYSSCLRIMTHKKQTNVEIVSTYSATQILWQYYGSSYHLTLLFFNEQRKCSFIIFVHHWFNLGGGAGSSLISECSFGKGKQKHKMPPPALFLSFSAAAHLSKKRQTFCFLSAISWLVPPYNVAVLNFNFESLISNVMVFGGPLVTEQV